MSVQPLVLGIGLGAILLSMYGISTFIWLLSYGIHVGKYTMHGRDSWIRRLSPMSKKKAKATNLGVVFGNEK